MPGIPFAGFDMRESSHWIGHLVTRLLMGWLMLAAGVAGASAGASGGVSVDASSSAASAPDLAAALNAHQPFVAVLVDRADAKLAATEAYADWYGCYQQFVKQGRGDLPVHVLTPARARAHLPALRDNNGPATLFVNAEGQALVHQGLVLEPQVYVMGRAFAEGGRPPERMADYGLTAVRLRR